MKFSHMFTDHVYSVMKAYDQLFSRNVFAQFCEVYNIIVLLIKNVFLSFLFFDKFRAIFHLFSAYTDWPKMKIYLCLLFLYVLRTRFIKYFVPMSKAAKICEKK